MKSEKSKIFKDIINAPNLLSFSRIILTPLVIYLVLQQKTYLVAIAFVISFYIGLSDRLDGYIARKLNLITPLGKFLDSFSDKVFIIGIFITFSSLDFIVLPIWFVFLLIFREFFITFLRIEHLISPQAGQFITSKEGKQKMFLQSLSVMIYFIIVIYKTNSANLEIGIIDFIPFLFFLLSLYYTFYSGFLYIKKNYTLSKIVFLKTFTTVFYTGYYTLGSGTLASLIVIILIYFFRPDLLVIIGMIFIISILGIIFIDQLEKKFGQAHDASFITIDEVLGVLIVLIPVMWLPSDLFTYGLLIAFIVFRALDIIKPLGIKWIDQNIEGGYGVMLDDAVAGIIGLVVMIFVIVLLG